MFGLLMAVSCIKKTIEYFFTKNKVTKWHWNIMVKYCVKMDNRFCCFMLIIGVLGYIFKMFCISVGMALYIGNASLKFYLWQIFILIHVFSYSSCKSIYFNINMSLSSLLNFPDIKGATKSYWKIIFVSATKISQNAFNILNFYFSN